MRVAPRESTTAAIIDSLIHQGEIFADLVAQENRTEVI